MLRNVFLDTLSETRRALVSWSLGLIGMAAILSPSTRPCATTPT